VAYSITSKGLLVNISPSSDPYGPQPTLILNQSFYYPWSYTCAFKAYLNITPITSNLSNDQLVVNICIKGVDN
jgi:hypothetical protein